MSRSDDLAAQLAAKLLSAEQVLQMPAPEWLVDGILPADALAVLFGRPGSSKTFAALDLACCVAMGNAFMAEHTTKQGKVIYVAAEGQAGMSIRLEAWMRTAGITELPDFFLFPHAIPLAEERYGPATVEMCRMLRPRLVVVDTLARAMVGGDENSTRDMSRLMDTIDQIRQASGATVLLVHHTTKGGESYRGNSALEGAMDTMLQMSEEEATGALTLSCFKQKEGEQFLPLHLTREVVTVRGGLITSCVLHLQDRMKMTAGQLTRELQLSSFIFNAPLGEEFTAKQLADLTGLAYGNVHRTLNALVNKSVLTARKSGRGNVYTMTRAQREDFYLHHPHLSSEPGQSLSSSGGSRRPPMKMKAEDEREDRAPEDDDDPPPMLLDCP